MDDQRGYLAKDESMVIIAKQQPQPSESVVAVAEAFKGLPYVWAGTSANSGFDCSGYVYEVMRLNGYSVPRMADHQFEQSRRVKKADLKRGDMVFFTTYLPGPSHVGIYLGDGEFIHASSAGEGVVVSQLKDGYYSERFLGGGRPDDWQVGEEVDTLVALTSEPLQVAASQEHENGDIASGSVSPSLTGEGSAAESDEDAVEPAGESAELGGRRDPFQTNSKMIPVPDSVPFDEQVDTEAEAAGLSFQLQLGEMLAVGRLKANDFLARLSKGLSALSPRRPEKKS